MPKEWVPTRPSNNLLGVDAAIGGRAEEGNIDATRVEPMPIPQTRAKIIWKEESSTALESNPRFQTNSKLQPQMLTTQTNLKTIWRGE